jgi:hypothetical protein
LIADAGLQASLAGPSWRLSFVPRVVARRYTGQNDLDSRDYLLQTSFTRSLERGQYALDASYSRQYTLTSQFAATGTVDQNVPRDSLTLGVSGNRLLTERWSLQGGLAAEDVSYPDGAEVGLFDYRYYTATGAASLGLSPRTSVSLVGRFGRFDSSVTGLTSREYTVGLGLDHAWDETWRVSLKAGPTLGTTNGRERGTGISYQGSLNGAWERSSFSLSVEHALSPNSSQGRLQVSDTVSASYNYRLTESLAATAYIRAEEYSDADDLPSALQQSFGTSSAGLSLVGALGQSLSWRVSYSHLVRDIAGSPRSNAVTAGITWRGLSRSSSY